MLCSQVTFAQNFLEGGRVSGNFQLDAQVYRADSAIGAYEVDEKMLMNAFANLLYSNGNFNAGLRFETYLNPIQGYDPRYKGSGVPYWFGSWRNDQFEITVGNFYEQFGSGMILRSYEERNLGYDNAFKGAKVRFSPADGVTLKGLIGTQRFFWEQGPGIVRGLNGEFALNDIFDKEGNCKTRVTLGGSFVSKYQQTEELYAGPDTLLILPANVASYAVRANVTRGKFALDGEYAGKMNDPSFMNNFIYKNGHSLLLQASFSTKGLGIIASAKRTDNMSYKSRRTESGSFLDINYLPALTRQHAYSLSAMYPYATQPNGEMALQGQVNYKIKRGSLIGGKYGTDIAVNYSRITSIKKETAEGESKIGKSGTAGYKSPFLAFGDELYFQDFNIEIQRKFTNSFKALISYIYQDYNVLILEGYEEPMVNAHIVIADATYRFDNKQALKMEYQHLITKQDEGDWLQVLVEYTFAPKWYFTLADQYNYGNSDNDKRFHYPTVSAGYTNGSNRLMMSYGKQREGIICVGGVCRNVPASNGLTLTLTSTF
ncbi:MAG: hypothetical protein CVT94_15540 [Bacteroidetes bacterium HGW-Bacteroidetes-11]|jgi:hypothetical protein|nr:MAG: hypothetical protein CVT94_15540 [Bacteroidetes bacterium HGW-Bacteroidetes-11]